MTVVETETPPTSDASGTETPQDAGSGSGDSGGTQDADTFAAERERYEQRLRDSEAQRARWQSEADRVKKELGQKAEPSGDPAPTGVTREEMREEMARATALNLAMTELRSDKSVEHADPTIFARAQNFDSPEAFRVAVEESHRERAALIEIGRKAALADSGQEEPDLGPSDSGSTVQVPAKPTKEQLAAMSPEELWAFEDKHGKAEIDRILVS